MRGIYKKIISLLVCSTFLVTNISYASSPTYQNLAAKLISQDPDQQEVVKAAAGRLTAMRYTIAVGLNGHPSNFVVYNEKRMNPDWAKYRVPDYDSVPEDWQKFSSENWKAFKESIKVDTKGNELPEHFLQLEDPIIAMEFFALSEAGLSPADVDIIEGWFPYDAEKGELPIAQIEPAGSGKYRIVLHTEFVQRWEHIRRNDVWFDVDLDGKKRTVSYAWSLLFWVAKHEMMDVQKTGLAVRTPKGGGHLFRGGLGGTYLGMEEDIANDIGGRYAEINEAMRLAFLHGYCINETSSFTDKGFKERARLVLETSDKNTPSQERLEEEFPLLSGKEKTAREIDIHMAFLTHYHFLTQRDEEKRIWAYPIAPSASQNLIDAYWERVRKNPAIEKESLKATGAGEDTSLQKPVKREFKKVLVVDVSKTVTNTLKRYFRMLGIEVVVTARSYEEAVEKVKESIEGGVLFDLILIDGNIPDTVEDAEKEGARNEKSTGIHVVLAARELSDIYKDVPVMLISTEGQGEIENNYQQLTGKKAPQDIFDIYVDKNICTVTKFTEAIEKLSVLSAKEEEREKFGHNYSNNGLDIFFNVEPDSFRFEAIGMIDSYILDPYAEHLRGEKKEHLMGAEDFYRNEGKLWISLVKREEEHYFKIVDTTSRSYVEGIIQLPGSEESGVSHPSTGMVDEEPQVAEKKKPASKKTVPVSKEIKDVTQAAAQVVIGEGKEKDLKSLLAGLNSPDAVRQVMEEALPNVLRKEMSFDRNVTYPRLDRVMELLRSRLDELEEGLDAGTTSLEGSAETKEEAERDMKKRKPIESFFPKDTKNRKDLEEIARRIEAKVLEVSEEISSGREGAITGNDIGIIPGGKTGRTMSVTVFPQSGRREIGIYQTYIENIRKLESLVASDRWDTKASAQKRVIDSLIRGSVLHEIGHGFEGFSHLDIYSLVKDPKAVDHYAVWADLVGYEKIADIKDGKEKRSITPEEKKVFSQVIAELNVSDKGGNDYVSNKAAYLFYRFITGDPKRFIGEREALADKVRKHFKKYPHYVFALRFNTGRDDEPSIEEVVNKVLEYHDLFFGEGTKGEKYWRDVFALREEPAPADESADEEDVTGKVDLVKINALIKMSYSGANKKTDKNLREKARKALREWGEAPVKVINEQLLGDDLSKEEKSRLKLTLRTVEKALRMRGATSRQDSGEEPSGKPSPTLRRSEKITAKFHIIRYGNPENAWKFIAESRELEEILFVDKGHITLDRFIEAYRREGAAMGLLAVPEEYMEEAFKKALGMLSDPFSPLVSRGYLNKIEEEGVETYRLSGRGRAEFTQQHENKARIYMENLRQGKDTEFYVAALLRMRKNYKAYMSMKGFSVMLVVHSALAMYTKITPELNEEIIRAVKDVPFVSHDVKKIAEIALEFLEKSRMPEPKEVEKGEMQELDITKLERNVTLEWLRFKAEVILRLKDTVEEGHKLEEFRKILENTRPDVVEAFAGKLSSAIMERLAMLKRKEHVPSEDLEKKISNGDDVQEIGTPPINSIEDLRFAAERVLHEDLSLEGFRSMLLEVNKPEILESLMQNIVFNVKTGQGIYMSELGDFKIPYDIVVAATERLGYLKMVEIRECEQKLKEGIDREEQVKKLLEVCDTGSIVETDIAGDAAKLVELIAAHVALLKYTYRDPKAHRTAVVSGAVSMNVADEQIGEYTARGVAREGMEWLNEKTTYVNADNLPKAGESSAEEEMVAAAALELEQDIEKEKHIEFLTGITENEGASIRAKTRAHKELLIHTDHNPKEHSDFLLGVSMLMPDRVDEETRKIADEGLDYLADDEGSYKEEGATSRQDDGEEDDETQEGESSKEKLSASDERFYFFLKRVAPAEHRIETHGEFLILGHQRDYQIKMLNEIFEDKDATLDQRIAIRGVLLKAGHKRAEQREGLRKLINESTNEQKTAIGLILREDMKDRELEKEEGATSGQDDGEEDDEVESDAPAFIDFIVNIGPKTIPDFDGVDSGAKIDVPKDQHIWETASEILDSSDIGLAIETDFELDKQIEDALRGKGRPEGRRKLDVGVETFSKGPGKRSLKMAVRALKGAGRKNIVILTLDAQGVPADIGSNLELFRDTMLFNMERADEQIMNDDNFRRAYQARVIMLMLIAASAKSETDPARKDRKKQILKYLIEPYLKDTSVYAVESFIMSLLKPTENVIHRFSNLVDYILSAKPVRAFNKFDEIEVLKNFWIAA